jgi:hypothetical protein
MRRKTDIDDATETFDAIQRARANKQAGLLEEDGPMFDGAVWPFVPLVPSLRACRQNLADLFGPQVNERKIA